MFLIKYVRDQISEKLLDMGQMQVAQVVGRTLLIEFDKCGASFASIRCRSVLAKIAYIEGHFPTAAATALSCRSPYDHKHLQR